jgi:hypothetical protein
LQRFTFGKICGLFAVTTISTHHENNAMTFGRSAGDGSTCCY